MLYGHAAPSLETGGAYVDAGAAAARAAYARHAPALRERLGAAAYAAAWAQGRALPLDDAVTLAMSVSAPNPDLSPRIVPHTPARCASPIES
jgi:hypothetical protein